MPLLIFLQGNATRSSALWVVCSRSRLRRGKHSTLQKTEGLATRLVCHSHDMQPCYTRQAQDLQPKEMYVTAAHARCSWEHRQYLGQSSRPASKFSEVGQRKMQGSSSGQLSNCIAGALRCVCKLCCWECMRHLACAQSQLSSIFVAMTNRQWSWI